ncbi:MAG: type II toxin-antitoxin system YafQ family toxin [Methylococcaceae bacterium]|nr:type II toxin-antitoxin system YafQ family toxin [Methylococcaceae bacterium]
MLAPVFTHQFKRDLKRLEKRNKDMDKLKFLMRRLLDNEPLEPKYRDHDLIGNYSQRRECHIEPNWLLIYKKEPDRIIFERTGSHADLF